MQITLVVDGYNAINVHPEAKKDFKSGNLEAARKTILKVVKEFARSSGYITNVKVVFDGDDQYRYLDAIDVSRSKDQIFSSAGTGDEKVIDTVRRFSKHGRVVLASNDNYVRNNARAYGAKLISCDELLDWKKNRSIKKKTTSKNIPKRLGDAITNEYRKELGL